MRENDEYFNFLLDIVDPDRHYTLMLNHFNEILFYPLVRNDENRGEDGKHLREIFAIEGGHMPPSFCLDKPCTILEMLIGLAFRMENELEGSRDERSTLECFGILIENLGFTWIDDMAYYQDGGKEVLMDGIDRLLERDYRHNGKGGLFPLIKHRRDQRKIEIWYQMQSFLQENFKI